MDKVKKLIVKYNNKHVGYLVDLDNSRIAFQYDDEWIENGFSISPFSLPLSTKIYENEKDYFSGLYGVFSDSLPDGWGELLVRRMLAKKGINPDRVSPLTKLTLVSGNGLGALMYEPCQTAKSDNTEFDLDVIAEESRKILEDEGGNVDLDKIFEFGGSSGGARPKAHIKINNEYWIVKFPSSFDTKNIGENEFQANQLAKKCGINVNEFRLFNSKKHTGYFGAKRFDRENIKKIHMISLSSLLETTHRIPSLDYLHLFQVIQKICVDQEDMYEAYRRMCFNVLYGNKDDHGKNFAFLYDENLRGYKLSPAYDITKTPNKTEHEMTVNGAGIPKENDLLEVAKIMKLSLEKCKTIIAKIKKVLKDNLKS
ncbi:MAG: type II toxin-antitoxin system HipA family toxin [Candidatus ainarchaeum sp.]|nr:type II toxin-antitoxin system HipA family toxin [Candidatus ainarchaeum sp.]